MGQVIKMPDPPTNYHYSVYEHRLIGPDGILYTRAFIVLKNQYGIIVRFTRLHNFLGIYEGKVCRPITADGVSRAILTGSFLHPEAEIDGYINRIVFIRNLFDKTVVKVMAG